jgi:hypothetical protein
MFVLVGAPSPPHLARLRLMAIMNNKDKTKDKISDKEEKEKHDKGMDTMKQKEDCNGK